MSYQLPVTGYQFVGLTVAAALIGITMAGAQSPAPATQKPAGGETRHGETCSDSAHGGWPS